MGLEKMGQGWKKWDNVGKNGTTFILRNSVGKNGTSFSSNNFVLHPLLTFYLLLVLSTFWSKFYRIRPLNLPVQLDAEIRDIFCSAYCGFFSKKATNVREYYFFQLFLYFFPVVNYMK